MSERLEQLRQQLDRALGDRMKSSVIAHNELTIVLDAAHYAEAAKLLRDDPSLSFEQLIDLCGVDYKDYADGAWSGRRFAVVSHLLSVKHNQRLRVRVFAPDDDYPLLASMVPIWNSANWFEREAFDLFGILFDGHDDLRRILTDYGFIGHANYCLLFRSQFNSNAMGNACLGRIFSTQCCSNLFCSCRAHR